MKIVKLLHNPNAGDSEHTAKKLTKLIEDKGYECRYASTKGKGWKEIEDDIDIIAVAGGDGTVRRVCEEMLKRTLLDKRQPLAVLPMGTANNIGNALGLMLETSVLVDSWQREHIKSVDIGVVNGHEDSMFFLEAFGFGVFPNLMNEMKKLEEEPATAEESLQKALEVLLKVVEEYEARECRLVIDGIDHSGNFLLVEIMNMPSIGPNLNLNPMADPGDGEFEIIMIPENQREKLANYVKGKMDDKELPFAFSALRGKDISISWQGIHAHVDDTVVKAAKSFNLKVDLNKGVIDILLPVSK